MNQALKNDSRMHMVQPFEQPRVHMGVHEKKEIDFEGSMAAKLNPLDEFAAAMASAPAEAEINQLALRQTVRLAQKTQLRMMGFTEKALRK